MKKFIITHDEVCPECDGWKEVLVGLDDARTCWECNGTGEVAGLTEVFDDDYTTMAGV